MKNKAALKIQTLFRVILAKDNARKAKVKLSEEKKINKIVWSKKKRIQGKLKINNNNIFNNNHPQIFQDKSVYIKVSLTKDYLNYKIYFNNGLNKQNVLVSKDDVNKVNIYIKI